MTTTTHPEFNHATEAMDVAKAFPEAIRGKTIFITGGNRAGISFATQQALASQSPARIIIAARTASKIQETIAALEAEYPAVEYRPLIVDLSLQKSVRAAAAEVLAWSDVPAIDIVINTAGVMGIPSRTMTEDGIEMHLATNHFGQWLLTCLIMPKIIKAAGSRARGATRVVNVSAGSPMVSAMRFSDPGFEKKNKELPEEEQPMYSLLSMWGYKDAEESEYVGLDAYNRSKVANVLCGIGITRRLFEKYGILGLSLHPGVIPTELARSFPEEILVEARAMAEKGVWKHKTLGAGASTSLVAALDPRLGPGEIKDGKDNYGAFLEDCQINHKSLPLAVSSEKAEELWRLSEEMVKEEFSW